MRFATILPFALVICVASAARADDPVPGDAAAGEKVFLQCRSCHQVGESARNQIGPVLNGLFGRHSGAVEGYGYSKANKESGLTWDEATFRDYIRDPKAKIPGTKMIYAGVKDDKRVSDLIAYLHTYDRAPVSLAKP